MRLIKALATIVAISHANLLMPLTAGASELSVLNNCELSREIADPPEGDGSISCREPVNALEKLFAHHLGETLCLRESPKGLPTDFSCFYSESSSGMTVVCARPISPDFSEDLVLNYRDKYVNTVNDYLTEATMCGSEMETVSFAPPTLLPIPLQMISSQRVGFVADRARKGGYFLHSFNTLDERFKFSSFNSYELVYYFDGGLPPGLIAKKIDPSRSDTLAFAELDDTTDFNYEIDRAAKAHGVDTMFKARVISLNLMSGFRRALEISDRRSYTLSKAGEWLDNILLNSSFNRLTPAEEVELFGTASSDFILNNISGVVPSKLISYGELVGVTSYTPGTPRCDPSAGLMVALAMPVRYGDGQPGQYGSIFFIILGVGECSKDVEAEYYKIMNDIEDDIESLTEE
ncbi:hypothetical protein [Paracoccus shanxieyensis]|uniref:Uncharacterized protein n=1 Tax=Paracoccus shanxieyensis TaxID=2675752 RepID=A0A6L6J5J6_9RHOB|nr:hypothetical protein [Paracoccus shanxieyensis]MTH66037.1 hypothetical protein [Paracoccus shanxieyensis]MTH89300.1 hypothetical protein [Paracoccus shanxieyensis]